MADDDGEDGQGSGVVEPDDALRFVCNATAARRHFAPALLLSQDVRYRSCS